MKEVLTKKGLSEKVGKETTFFAKRRKKLKRKTTEKIICERKAQFA